MNVTVVIPCLNEEKNVARCIRSVASWAQQIVAAAAFQDEIEHAILLRLGEPEVHQRGFLSALPGRQGVAQIEPEVAGVQRAVGQDVAPAVDCDGRESPGGAAHAASSADENFSIGSSRWG